MTQCSLQANGQKVLVELVVLGPHSFVQLCKEVLLNFYLLYLTMLKCCVNQVQVPSFGTETVECGVCQHPFLVKA